MKREIKKIKGKKEGKKAFFNSIKENVASCTASNQQTQGSVVARGVPWLPTCTPRVPPAPVIPPPCPATTALGARTWALGPTNPPGTTCTMPAVQAEGRRGGSPAWKPLAERRHPECISTPAIWELLCLAKNLAKGVREERFLPNRSRARRQAPREEGMMEGWESPAQAC